MGEDKKNSGKFFQMIFIVAVLAIGIILLWFFYLLPTSFNSADSKINTNDVFSSQNLKALGDRVKRAFDFTKNNIEGQVSELNNLNLNLDLNVNLPQLTNEQVEDLRKKVEEFAQNVNQNQNDNLNNINQ